MKKVLFIAGIMMSLTTAPFSPEVNYFLASAATTIIGLAAFPRNSLLGGYSCRLTPPPPQGFVLVTTLNIDLPTIVRTLSAAFVTGLGLGSTYASLQRLSHAAKCPTCHCVVTSNNEKLITKE